MMKEFYEKPLLDVVRIDSSIYADTLCGIPEGTEFDSPEAVMAAVSSHCDGFTLNIGPRPD